MIERAVLGAGNNKPPAEETPRIIARCRGEWWKRTDYARKTSPSRLVAPQSKQSHSIAVPDYSQVSPENEIGGRHYLNKNIKVPTTKKLTPPLSDESRPSETDTPLAYRNQLRQSLQDRIKQELLLSGGGGGGSNRILGEAYQALTSLEGPDFRYEASADPLGLPQSVPAGDENGEEEGTSPSEPVAAHALARPELPPPPWRDLSTYVDKRLGELSGNDQSSATAGRSVVSHEATRASPWVPEATEVMGEAMQMHPSAAALIGTGTPSKLNKTRPKKRGDDTNEYDGWSFRRGASASPPAGGRHMGLMAYMDSPLQRASRLRYPSEGIIDSVHGTLSGTGAHGFARCSCAPMLGEQCGLCRGAPRGGEV